jgi:hypothetical protein
VWPQLVVERHKLVDSLQKAWRLGRVVEILLVDNPVVVVIVGAADTQVGHKIAGVAAEKMEQLVLELHMPRPLRQASTLTQAVLMRTSEQHAVHVVQPR